MLTQLFSSWYSSWAGIPFPAPSKQLTCEFGAGYFLQKAVCHWLASFKWLYYVFQNCGLYGTLALFMRMGRMDCFHPVYFSNKEKGLVFLRLCTLFILKLHWISKFSCCFLFFVCWRGFSWCCCPFYGWIHNWWNFGEILEKYAFLYPFSCTSLYSLSSIIATVWLCVLLVFENRSWWHCRGWWAHCSNWNW